MVSLLGFPRVFGTPVGGVGAGGGGGLTYVQRVAALSPIQYLPLNEEAGATTALDASGNGRTGTPANVTFGAVDFPKGGKAPAFNGTSSQINAFSASLAGAFSAPVGSAIMWVRYTGVWADGVTRVALRLLADGSNLIQGDKLGIGTSFRAGYIAAGTSSTVADTAVAGTTDWIFTALTWDKAEDRVRGYTNGVIVGSPLTGLGTWAGALAVASIGSASGANYFTGNIAHYALFNYKLSAAQIASLYN